MREHSKHKHSKVSVLFFGLVGILLSTFFSISCEPSVHKMKQIDSKVLYSTTSLKEKVSDIKKKDKQVVLLNVKEKR